MRITEHFPATKLGGFKLSTKKPDDIKVMCSLSTLLKIYTAGETFRVQTPEDIDPARTNPYATFVNA